MKHRSIRSQLKSNQNTRLAFQKQIVGFISAQQELGHLVEEILSTEFISQSGLSIKTIVSLMESYNQFLKAVKSLPSPLQTALETDFKSNGIERLKEKVNSILYSFLGQTIPSIRYLTQSSMRMKSPTKSEYYEKHLD